VAFLDDLLHCDLALLIGGDEKRQGGLEAWVARAAFLFLFGGRVGRVVGGDYVDPV